MLCRDHLVAQTDIADVGDFDVGGAAIGAEAAADDGQQVLIVEFAILVDEFQGIDQEMVLVGELLVAEDRASI